jgi:hypothetical protein
MPPSIASCIDWDAKAYICQFRVEEAKKYFKISYYAMIHKTTSGNKKTQGIPVHQTNRVQLPHQKSSWEVVSHLYKQ